MAVSQMRLRVGQQPLAVKRGARRPPRSGAAHRLRVKLPLQKLPISTGQSTSSS
jgi:hypothetical protein